MFQNHALFGIPLPFIGFACFILAFIFLYVWPKQKAQKYNRISWPRYILHFFQSLGWVLVGMAAIAETSSLLLSGSLAGLGLLVFVVFAIVALRA